MSAQPLVSCIMPTCDRRQFAGQAVWYFLRQDYPARELLIVDSGFDRVTDLVPADRRIRYLAVEPGTMSLGAMRNLACEQSGGELIAHWDDDDWMAPDRLRAQVAVLADGTADLCGASDLLHYGLEEGSAWRYRHPDGGRPWLAGGTLVYRRGTWAERRFADVGAGEDVEFVARVPAERRRAIVDPPYYLAVLHPGNVSAPNLLGSAWERRPFHEVSDRLDLDRGFYAALRHGPRGNGRRQLPVPTVNVAATFVVYDGYGSVAEYLVRGMARAGAAVDVTPFRLDPAGLSQEFLDLLGRSEPDPAAPTLCFAWWGENLDRFAAVRDLFLYTMWETSELPRDWPVRLNRARAVIVPTRFVAEVFRRSGVTVPVEVVAQGVDPERYAYTERLERPGLTTLMVGVFVPRKNVLEGVEAWKLAFAGDPDARLVIKSRFQWNLYAPDDPRIRFVDTNEPTQGIAHWYQQADVLMALGNEGFGLPLVEAMATGLPVVALDSEGQRDLCQDAGDRLLPVPPRRWVPVDDPPYGPCGVRGVPAVEDIADRLRWVDGHRAEARALGRAASDWVLGHRNIWAMGPAVAEVMERHVRPPRPLRSLHTVWAPGGPADGLAGPYAAALAASLPSVRIVTGPPDLASTRLLQIEHEPDRFDETLLTRQVQQAAAAGVPVVVTEHVVGQEAGAWERDADVLAALTAPEAAVLQARWAGKRVELLPAGCPPPAATARAGPGPVVGVFGPGGDRDGCWALLLGLTGLPGAELLVLGPPGRPEQERRLQEEAAGLLVRRERPPPEPGALAPWLAARTDALVFWPDEPDPLAVAAATRAVRAGLASGVPTITPATAWFADVAEATHQPEHPVEGVHRVLADPPLRDRLAAAARDYCRQWSWSQVAKRHLSLWRSLHEA
jgi:glycosyltransferase involved in cell wall biosynthesis